MITKYEIVHKSPNGYSVVEHGINFLGFKYSKWVKDYQGFMESWYDLDDAERWVNDAIEYHNHVVKTVKVYELDKK